MLRRICMLPGMASDKDVLQAKQELISAEAEERRIKDVFSIYNFSGNAYYQLKSPVSGFIVEKQISRDMQLRPDQSEELFTISGVVRRMGDGGCV